jgi:aerobic carbon-monoxide dehydrogenase medium subunit
MYPYPFSYHRPASVDEALALLGEHGDSGKLLAGGHSLLPIMKLRLAQPEHLIEISGLSDLAGGA